MKLPPIVSAQDWEFARERLLVKEKEVTRARDALAAERRRMPRVLVDERYTFDGPDGHVGLLDLFEGRRQLIIYRFFYEPGVTGLFSVRGWFAGVDVNALFFPGMTTRKPPSRSTGRSASSSSTLPHRF